MSIIQATHLTKRYGKTTVLSNINLSVEAGEIIGVVGINGAGKSTLLKSLLGLAQVSGNLKVCGLDPRQAQHKLMDKVSFIADTATLPKWITPEKLFEYTAKVHPNFKRELAERFLANTNIKPNQLVKKMSKGMVTQLHLAIVIAIESELLILDEPTLGLDIIRRKIFYNSLLEDYYDDNNTILITTHQIEEIEHILTRVIFIDEGQIVLDIQVEDIPKRFAQLSIQPTEQTDAMPHIKALNPIQSMQTISGTDYIFDHTRHGGDLSDIEINETLSPFGQLKTPSLADIFVALLNSQNNSINSATNTINEEKNTKEQTHV